MAIQFVGYAAVSINTGDFVLKTQTISLTSLNGGIGLSPLPGDVIVLASGMSSTSDLNPGPTTAGYTELVDTYSVASNYANLSVSYMVVGATPPTSVTVSALDNKNNGAASIAAVFRGVDTAFPIDATTTVASQGGNQSVDPPAITPVTTGAALIIISAIASDNAGSFTGVPLNFFPVTERSIKGTIRAFGIRMDYRTSTNAGMGIDPPVNAYNTGGSGASWISASMLLKPNGGNIKTWNGSTWVGKPARVWNGASWVAKPVKYWNGTAWVRTRY